MSTPLTDPLELQEPPGLQDPLMLPQETAYHVSISEQNTAGDLLKVGAAIGAAFYGYRWYMQRRLREELKGRQPTSEEMREAVERTFKRYDHVWVRTILPHLVSGYAHGLRDVPTGSIPEEVLIFIAEDYAWRLGEHLNDVSAEAVVTGYQAQLNRKVPPQRAAENVIEAFGVNPRAMNSLIDIWTSEEPKITSNVVPINHKKSRAQRVIDSAVAVRAKVTGENESWATRSQAKQIVWMYGVETGAVPENTKRRWVTADDERVCPSCGPMNGKAVGVTERFSAPGYGKVWSPPLHPNCRCDMQLDIDYTAGMADQVREQVGKRELVMKARPGDPYDRDRSGKFAAQEQRAPAQVQRALVRPPYAPDPDLMRRLEATLHEEENLLNQYAEMLKPVSIDDGRVGVSRVAVEQEPVEINTPVSIEQPVQIGSKIDIAKPTKIGSKIDLEQGTKIGGKVDLSGKVSISEKVNLGEQKSTKVDVGQKVDVGYGVDTVTEEGTGLKEQARGTAVALPSKHIEDQELVDVEEAKEVDTDHASYQKLDHELAFFLDPHDVFELEDAELLTQDMVTTEDDLWLSTGRTMDRESSFEQAVAEHWQDIIGDKMMVDFYERRPEGEANTVLIAGELEIQVDQEMWYAAATEAVYGVRGQGSEKFPTSALNTSTKQRQAYVLTASQIADFFEMREMVTENLPVVAVAEHGIPGATDIHHSKYGTEAKNPGAWRVSSVDVVGHDQTLYPYKRVRVIPRDLDD